MEKEGLEIVGVKVMLEDGTEVEPSCWALAFLERDKNDKPWITYSWSRGALSAEEIMVLGAAIEKLLAKYSQDDAIKAVFRIIGMERNTPT